MTNAGLKQLKEIRNLSVLDLSGNPITVQELIDREIPAARRGLPSDVANLAVFLASPASDYITGQAINVDGGSVWGN